MYRGSCRRCKPTATIRFFFLAFSLAAKNRRTPGASVAIGFSMKMCLPASTALEMNRPEMRRRGDHHQVRTAVDRLVIGIEPGESAAPCGTLTVESLNSGSPSRWPRSIVLLIDF